LIAWSAVYGISATLLIVETIQCKMHLQETSDTNCVCLSDLCIMRVIPLGIIAVCHLRRLSSFMLETQVAPELALRMLAQDDSSNLQIILNCRKDNIVDKQH